MNRLDGLDALRGVAALVILAYHVMSVVLGIRTEGFLAVDFFFVLSGYVMARTLDAKPQGVISFATARYRRFWPTMAVGAALGVSVALFNGQTPSPWIIAASLLLIPSATGMVFPLNSPTWSIFFELVANSLHPLLSTKSFAALFVLSTAVMIAASAKLGAFGFGPILFPLGFARVFMAYSLGALLYTAWRDRPPFTVRLGLGVFALVFLLLFRAWPGFGFVFVLLMCPLIIASGLTAMPAWGRALGALSFPLYATHVPILLATQAAGLHWLVGVGGSIAVAMVMAAVTSRQSVIHARKQWQ